MDAEQPDHDDQHGQIMAAIERLRQARKANRKKRQRTGQLEGLDQWPVHAIDALDAAPAFDRAFAEPGPNYRSATAL